jgi:hypothetical protein
VQLAPSFPFVFAAILLPGCGPRAGAESGGEFGGVKNQAVLLANGSFGVFCSGEAPLATRSPAFLFLNDALFHVTLPPFPELPKGAGTVKWSFDLDMGELITSIGNYEVRTIVDPVLPIVARKIKPAYRMQDEISAAAAGMPSVPMVPGELPSIPKIIFESATNGDDTVAGLQTHAHTPYDVPETYDAVFQRAKSAMERFWQTDIEIDGPPQDALAVRSMLFYVRKLANEKLSPFGATNARYRGLRFWDAEAWQLPVLALTDPKLAADATRWRSKCFALGYVPWEQDSIGKDRTPPEFRRALHQAGWVAWWTQRAAALGLIETREAKRYAELANAQFKARMSTSDRGIELLQVESPDEGRLRNNDLVTNLLAKMTAEYCGDSGLAQKIVVPRAEDGLPCSYDNDSLVKYQQAAALLALFPLEWPFDDDTGKRMFDRYKAKIIDVGPAMADSIHATISARFGRADEAYSYWLDSWKPFLSKSMVFCEKRVGSDGYFVTGAAGCLQAVIYGFLGLRISKKGIDGSPQKKLLNGYVLSVQPHLPRAWKSIRFRNVQLLGKSYDIYATHERVVIEEGGK